MKKQIGRILRRLMPLSVYKLIANGFIIVPKYYKSALSDLENFHTMALQDSDEKNVMLMRKFGHILDKALHRKDAKPGHSKEVYEDLKNLLESLSHTCYSEDPTYKWAVERIVKYEQLQHAPERFEPFRAECPEVNISYDELLTLIKQRRTCREFKPESISPEEVKKLVEVVNWAASSCNKQPIHLFYTTDQDKAKEAIRCCKGGTAFGDEIPSFWVFTANSMAYVWPSEMYLPTLDVSLGAQNLFLAAHTLGISGCILSWAQKSKEEEFTLRKLLDIPEEYVICFCAVLGKPKKTFCTPARKSVL